MLKIPSILDVISSTSMNTGLAAINPIVNLEPARDTFLKGSTDCVLLTTGSLCDKLPQKILVKGPQKIDHIE